MSLVKIIKGDLFTDSFIIANGTNNEHESVRCIVRKYEQQFRQLGTLAILNRESTGGRPEQYYNLNEMQATFLITLLRNNDIVVSFKLCLVKEFYKMCTIIMQKQTSEWQITRKQGKLIRRDETDTIQKLILLAQEQGSKNSNRLYTNYTNLVNKAVGIDSGMRDIVSYKTLMLIAMLEDMISNTILEEIENGTFYKTIYQKCKAKVEQFAKLAYIDKMHLGMNEAV